MVTPPSPFFLIFSLQGKVFKRFQIKNALFFAVPKHFLGPQLSFYNVPPLIISKRKVWGLDHTRRLDWAIDFPKRAKNRKGDHKFFPKRVPPFFFPKIYLASKEKKT